MSTESGSEVTMYRRILTSNVTLRWLVAIMLVFMCFMRMVATYPGLDQPVAMDQAQIARELANGNGFSTKFLRPKTLENAAGPKLDKILDLDHMKDTMHAPLNICAMAVALKVTGFNDFEKHRMEEETAGPDGAVKQDSYPTLIYNGDRVISSVSMFFFVVAVVLAYLLGRRMFDEFVGACTATFMIFSSLMLDYAVSGLPQMLMLCCMLGCIHFVLSAVAANTKNHLGEVLAFMSLAYVCVTLLSLSGWMGLWCAFGLIVFAGMYFRPFGAFAIPGFIIVGIGLLFSIAGNLGASGSVVGDAFYGLYDGLGSGSINADSVLRATGTDNQEMESTNFVLRVIGYACSQFSGIYANMGTIIVAPFFLLALINPYKNKAVDGSKWAIFSMWCFSCLGMALYGVDTPFNPSQMGIIFAPLFALYGITLVFNFIARFKLGSGQFTAARGLAMFFMIIVSAGPMISTLPSDLWDGFRFRFFINQSPTYVPPALNIKLADATDPSSIIATDQPWAVAWYANRKALWLPTKASSYTDVLAPIIENAQIGVDADDKPVKSRLQGILLTSISRSPVAREVSISRKKRDRAASMGGLVEVSRHAGDFWGLVMLDGARQDGQKLTGMPICKDEPATVRNIWGGSMVFFDFGKKESENQQ